MRNARTDANQREVVRFFVPGIPRPAGSKRAFQHRTTKRVMVVDSSGKRGKDWRGDVMYAAQQATDGQPLEGPLKLTVDFVMPRPKSHLNSKGDVKASAPAEHTKRPDATKLLRALEDALTGILWGDDAQICWQVVTKCYGQRIGAAVMVEQL